MDTRHATRPRPLWPRGRSAPRRGALLLLLAASLAQAQVDIAVWHEIVGSGVLADGSDRIDYLMEVANLGDGPATQVKISTVLPPEFFEVEWTCTGTGGADCEADQGFGDIRWETPMAAGAAFLFELSVRVADPRLRPIEHGIGALSGWEVDANPDNDWASTTYRRCPGAPAIDDPASPLPPHACVHWDGFEPAS
jgi:uncharacterized repeat protein (TIGR01451 family)